MVAVNCCKGNPMTCTVIESICSRAAIADKTIVLPEAQDSRVLEAARQITDRKLARIILLGDQEKILSDAQSAGIPLGDIEIINPLTDTDREKFVDILHHRRRHKDMSHNDAEKLLARPVYFGGMLVGQGRADGMVAGSICPTRDTVRSALFGVGTSNGNKTVSACSILNTVIDEIGVDGSVIFADTGVVREPTVEQLAEIAIAAAGTCRSLLGVEPYVAMLSYSTKGSAYSPAVQKVIDATKLAQEKRPDLNIDGELQLDAAILPDVAQRKAHDSQVAGRANTLIFPDLNSGNIAYKLVERLGRATALGPLLQGLAKPVNDLSRGCSIEDITLVSAITAVQAGA